MSTSNKYTGGLTALLEQQRKQKAEKAGQQSSIPQQPSIPEIPSISGQPSLTDTPPLVSERPSCSERPSLIKTPRDEETPSASQQPSVSEIRVRAISGYTSVPNTVWDSLLRMLPPNDQLVYLRLYRLAQIERRGWCSVGLKAIQDATNLSRASVIRSLARLETQGLISRSERASTSHSNRFAVREPSIHEHPGISQQPSISRKPSGSQTPMKEILKENIESAVANAPAGPLTKFDIRKVAARLWEAEDGRETTYEGNVERWKADIRHALIGQGIDVDDATIAEAIAGIHGA